jgi:hypothetical protein
MSETMAERLRFGFSVPVSPEWLPDGKVLGGVVGERDCGGDCGERGGRSVDKDFTLPEEPRTMTSSISVLNTYSTIPVVRARM